MVFDQMLPPPPSRPVAEPFVNKAELAAHYRVCTRTIERWVAADMPRYYIGKREMRFRLSEVQLWLLQNHINRFAAQGIATTMSEVQRRVVHIPILNGPEILNAVPPSPLGCGDTGGGAKGRYGANEVSRGQKAPTRVGEGQTSTTPKSKIVKRKSEIRKPVLTPRCKPGRKPKHSPESRCHEHGHKWRTSRYTRTCARCGLTEERNTL